MRALPDRGGCLLALSDSTFDRGISIQAAPMASKQHLVTLA